MTGKCRHPRETGVYVHDVDATFRSMKRPIGGELLAGPLPERQTRLHLKPSLSSGRYSAQCFFKLRDHAHRSID
ncbi:hypothetical protein [Bradyrhizobium sp. HKCCYLS2033]|uniref:hypothetical protein n=1 Tax=Bradyrhizobium sp. HKCCYLS2033 TaxID=3420739 RepID=UPI003EBFB377